MASLKLEHIYKVYPNGHKAVTDFNMRIKDGEFIVFVGPSGCGKSTTLRMIAGLEEISSGELYIGDTLVNDMQPKDRDIAMVFQNYALYPHMTVYENMAFGLTLRKIPRTEIHEKVMWAADVLGLTDYLDRKPKAMSGGQRQRVSLGRAILRNPKVMLLDEPLSNLDAKLRSQMRSMISKLHQQLKTTFIYVTHDQVEAMTLGTRVVVMKLGFVQQIDTPQNLYDYPINKFVAGFIGTPQMNFFNVTLKEEGDKVRISWVDAPQQPPLYVPSDALLKAEKKYLQDDIDVTLGFRCEAISAEEKEIKKGDNVINVVVSHFEELGNETLIYGDLNGIDDLKGGSKTTVIIKASSKMGHKPGDVIKARVNVDKIHLFDNKTEMTIIPPVPANNVLPISVINGKMNLFGDMSKPESINVDYLEKGTITLPLSALKANEGSIKGKIVLVEKHEEGKLALVEVNKKKIFLFVDDTKKVGDEVNIAIDFSQATFKDEEDNVVCSPLIERDHLFTRFVNYKTVMEESKNEQVQKIHDERVKEVAEKYAALEEELKKEKQQAFKEAEEQAKAVAPRLNEEKARIAKHEQEAKEEIRKLSATYSQDVKAIKAKHDAIIKEAVNKIEEDYKKIWANEKADYQKAMATNKDKESRRSRKLSYQIFKESFPQMKANDLERKTNSLEFDKETELNGVKARFAQQKALLKDKVATDKVNFNKEYFPVQYVEGIYKKKEKEFFEEKKDALLRAELLFFFKFNNYYQLIPDDITLKIIQGLGNRVFTKIFRIEVPHDGYVEEANTIEFKAVTSINYGDVKLYKCKGQIDGEEFAIHIRKPREIKLGEKVNFRVDLAKSQIYEDERDIRLY